MSRVRPLRATGTDAERRLLAAGSAERPDAASMRRTAEALGILPRVLVFAAALALALRTTRWTPGILRWLLPLAGVGAIAVIAYQMVERPGPAASTRIAPSAGGIAGRASSQTDGPATATRSAEPAGDLPRPVLVASETVGPPPRPHAAPRAKTRPVARVAALALTADSLHEQAELLDRARVRIAAGDPAGGLAVLDDFDRRFADAPLSEESMVLRIEALARRGDQNVAAALGRQFLKTYPTSVHADRVSLLLHSLSP
jgi:hypothetical protein